jgi:uncharacterized DUF497 family protein
VDFEWNEEKRQKILKERSLDFADAFQFFPSPTGDPSADTAWRRGAVEINRAVRRQIFHGRLDVARCRDPGHFDEAKP